MKSKILFTAMPCPEQKAREETVFCIGIEMSIGDRRIPCPLTEACRSYEELSAAVEQLKAGLDRILIEAGERLFPPSDPNGVLITPDMPTEVVWSHLCKVQNEDAFAATFNRLGEPLRRKVAEHILTKCNIFSGKGAVFSARYNNVTGMLD